ncbi:retrovirus-related pol polyprotein from transposon TNT 1-94, partial [Tanacetum coccineum]
MSPTPICFLAKASPTQAWLWHRRLSYLNFDTINLLSKKDIVIGLPKRPMIPNPDNTQQSILEPLSKMTEGNKKQYIADVRVMYYILQAIPNDIYNSVDACKNAKEMWERVKRLMFGSDVTTMAKKVAKNHDPLTLIAYSNTSSSQSHASSSYSPQSYYVTHPSSVVDYDDEYQGELQGDSQEDKLTTSMMLLARAISQKFSSPTNNRLRISSNTRNQAVVQDGNASDESNQIVQRVPRTDSSPSKANVQCYNCNEKGHYARECQKPKVHDAKYFREQMLLAMKDERNLSNEENDFMLDNSYGEESLKELTAAVMLMARLQPADDNAENVSSYDAKAVSEVNASFMVHEQVSHVKRKTIIQTTDDDQIDLSIIFDDPFVENNGGTSEHDSNAHDKNHEIQMLAYNLAKKAFKDRENRYLEDIVDLEEKLSSHDRIVYKMGQSIQTIHMLGKKPNKVYDYFLKDGLGYQNPERLKKAITAQPKLYNGDLLHSVNLKIDSPDSEETLEDAEESRLKMRNKMVQINYGKLNALYETFVPQQEFSSEQTYFSIPSTSNNGSESKDVPPELPTPKMPKETTRAQHQKEVDEMFEHVKQKTYAFGDVRAENQNLLMTIFELKNKLRTIEKGKNVNTKFDKSKTLGKLVCVTSFNKNLANKAKNVSNTKVNSDRSKPVTSQSTPKTKQSQKHNENVIARGMYKITKQETKTPVSKANINVSNSTGVGSSNSVRRLKSKDNKSKNNVLKNTKSSSTYVWKTSSSASLDSNKCETTDSNVCQTNACISNFKTVNACVTAVNDGSNIVCISCGKDVFFHSHEKCVARHALSRKSSVKRALFTSPVAAKSKNLGATLVVAKSRLSVAKTPITTN